MDKRGVDEVQMYDSGHISVESNLTDIDPPPPAKIRKNPQLRMTDEENDAYRILHPKAVTKKCPDENCGKWLLSGSYGFHVANHKPKTLPCKWAPDCKKKFAIAAQKRAHENLYCYSYCRIGMKKQNDETKADIKMKRGKLRKIKTEQKALAKLDSSRSNVIDSSGQDQLPEIPESIPHSPTTTPPNIHKIFESNQNHLEDSSLLQDEPTVPSSILQVQDSAPIIVQVQDSEEMIQTTRQNNLLLLQVRNLQKEMDSCKQELDKSHNDSYVLQDKFDESIKQIARMEEDTYNSIQKLKTENSDLTQENATLKVFKKQVKEQQLKINILHQANRKIVGTSKTIVHTLHAAANSLLSEPKSTTSTEKILLGIIIHNAEEFSKQFATSIANED